MTEVQMFAWTCQTCRGKGTYEDNPTETCRICEGKGRSFVHGGREEFTMCTACGANGYYSQNRRDTCATCAGIGLMLIPSVTAKVE